MRHALAFVAAAAAMGSALSASAATVLLDEDYADIRTWPDWVLVSKDTTQGATGSSSILATTVGVTQDYIRFVAGVDSGKAIPSADFDPAVATLSFKYKLEIAETLPITMAFQYGSWGTPLVQGSTVLTGDGQWHDATINFSSGWIAGAAPAPTDQLSHLRIEKEAASFWTPTEMNLHLDTFVYAVPEPTSLGLLAVGGMLALRRRS